MIPSRISGFSEIITQLRFNLSKKADDVKRFSKTFFQRVHQLNDLFDCYFVTLLLV